VLTEVRADPKGRPCGPPYLALNSSNHNKTQYLLTGCQEQGINGKRPEARSQQQAASDQKKSDLT